MCIMMFIKKKKKLRALIACYKHQITLKNTVDIKYGIQILNYDTFNEILYEILA